MAHDTPEKPPSPKDSLMGELESIKDLLDKDASQVIPTLDDSIAEGTEDQASPLNLDSIFDELASTPPPGMANPLSTTAQQPLIPVLDEQASSFTEQPQPGSDTTSEDENASRTKPERQPQTDFSIDLLIQEIVDEHIPLIEAELRERLSQCEPEIIRQLANKKTGP